MKITKVFALIVLTISVSSGLLGCAIKENTTETVDKNTVSNDKASGENSVIEYNKEKKSNNEEKKTQSEYNEYLQKENEEIIISFSIADSDKLAALCVSKEEPSYIAFRLGRSENVEFEFPDNLTDSWNKFIYSYYLRGGGIENEGLDLNYLRFEYNGTEYQLFQEYSAESDATDVGIRTIDSSTNNETVLRASEDSIKGDLRELRAYDKIKTEVQ
ncbi:MAG: hypothetical protein GX757_03070 [Clostridiales bacterium]|nr:hypothetical protein [Clostridiales bacterium]